MKAAWLGIAILLSGTLLYLGVRQVHTHKLRFVADDDLRRLTKVTLQLFQGGRPPTEQEFWARIEKKEPMKDPWGNPYRLESPQNSAILWRSAGPDGILRTEDDLKVIVPFGDGINIDLTPPQLEDPTPPSTDVI